MTPSPWNQDIFFQYPVTPFQTSCGEIDLPIVRMEVSQKAARGVHLTDLARYLDAQHQKATIENDKLHGRTLRKAS